MTRRHGTNVTSGTVPEFVVTGRSRRFGAAASTWCSAAISQSSTASRARGCSPGLKAAMSRSTASSLDAPPSGWRPEIALTIASTVPLVQRHRPAPENMPLDVLFEDETCLAVNKAAGIVIHPAYKHVSGTLINALLWRARDWPSGQRPSLLGRLDRDTSGVVIVAKSAAAHAALQRALQSGRATKDYLAIAYGRVPRRGTHRDAPQPRFRPTAAV